MRKRNRMLGRWAVLVAFTPLFFYAVWLSGSFVLAFNEERQVHIFPTQVDAVGWENRGAVLSQELPDQAPYSRFSANNSASIEIDTAAHIHSVVVEPSLVSDTSPAATAPTVTPTSTVELIQIPTTPDSGTGDTLSVPPIVPDMSTTTTSWLRSMILAMAQQVVPTTYAQTEDIASTSETVVASTTLEQVLASSTADTNTAVSTPAITVPDMPTCRVREDECHTISFTGFGVAGALTHKNFKSAHVSFSFGSLSPDDVQGSGKLQVRYFHAGAWHATGDVYLSKEVSNKTNGGYFTASLDEISDWGDLSDIKVVVEYVRGDQSPPIRVYLDALWVDATYSDRPQDILAGPSQDELSDLPANVSASLEGSNESPSLLIADDGTHIQFPYLDNLGADVLVLRTDKANYPAEPGVPQDVFVSVTNTSAHADAFFSYISFASASSSLISLSQYERNVPIATSTNEQKDVVYFCSSGWYVQAASSSVQSNRATQYACDTSGEVHACSRVSADDSSCIVSGELLPGTPSTIYTDGWIPVAMTDSASDRRVSDDLPTGYRIAMGSAQPITILPGQTLYFKYTIATDDIGPARFMISAAGEHAGNAFSLRLQTEDALRAQSKPTKHELIKPQLNDQVSTTTDFTVDQMPSFHFKWKTQRNLFLRLVDVLTNSQKHYEVGSARLVHANGEQEHVPVQISYGTGNEWTLSLQKTPRNFRPGKYTLELEIAEGGATYSDNVEFYWGVLALNPDQTVYEKGQTAHMHISVLDDLGDTVCGANLQLVVTAPAGDQNTIPVASGGGCGHNNVTSLPDYVATYMPGDIGTYTLTLERLDESGAIVNESTDQFQVVDRAPYLIVRDGPTRIYPPSPYTMHLSVTARDSFSGVIVESLPEGFTVLDAGGARVRRADGVQYLDWDVSLQSGGRQELSYTFKAPQVSPYMYLLGPLAFTQNGTTTYQEIRSWRIAADAIAIATGVAWLSGNQINGGGTELNNSGATALSWNLSADYDTTYYSYSSSSPTVLTVSKDGDYLISATLPMNRTDGSTRRTRVQMDVYVGGIKKAVSTSRSAYISNRSGQVDSSDHLNVLLKGLKANDSIEVYETSIDTVNTNDHLVVTGQASLYAEYIDSSQSVYFATGTTTSTGTNFNPAATSTVVWYDDSTLGRKDSNYTHTNTSASSTVTLGAAGYYLVYVNIPLSGALTSANVRGRILVNGVMATGGDFKQGYIENSTGDTASSIHWSGIVNATSSNAALTIAVQQEGATGTLTIGSEVASIYIQQLPGDSIFASRAKSLTGGTSWNVTPKQSVSWVNDDVTDSNTFTHSTTTNQQNVTLKKDGDYLLVFNDSHTGAVTRANQIVSVEIGGTAQSGAQTKTHYISNSGGQVESSGSLVYLLRNITANSVLTVSSLLAGAAGTITEDADALLTLWRKAPQSIYIQDTERWYANTNAATTTDPWPSGAIDVNEGDPLTAGTPVKSGDVLRLRIALQTTANSVAGADSFKLQYAPGSTCSPALAWTDVGAIGSASIWRGYDNAGVTAGATLSTTNLQLTVSSTTESYEEQNPSAAAPRAITAGTDGEWDWALQNNGAANGTNYCFRMVLSSGQTLKDYTDYPQLITDAPPDAPALAAPFDNEKVASSTPWLQFSTSDQNGENEHFEVQISTDPTFATTVFDQDSINNFSQFQNLDTPANKAPFNDGENIRYTPSSALSNGTTYWWRVRAKDPSGSNTWGDYSAAKSFTVDTSVTVSTWFQTTQTQFNGGTLSQLQTTAGEDVQLSGANTTGTIWSPEIDYSQKTTGNSWGSVSWHDVQTGGTIRYHIEYYTSTSSWALVPDTDLAGNAAGFLTSPIAITGLDTDTYAAIRLRADFTKTSASPILQDWTVAWALSVLAPAVSKPFDNEKIATTTPTFQFTTTDPQNNPLQYQIQWSTNATFQTGVSSSTSGISTGFLDMSSSTASNPFPSGDSISYTLPSGSALTNGTTYWWRVRARDPSGGNAWSLWSNSQSITVDTSLNASTWFQTTNEQFSTNSLVRVGASAGSATFSSDTGKVAIYRAATAGENVTTSTFTDGWDTTVRQDNIYSLTGTTTVNLQKGHYAVLYGARFTGSGTQRAAIQSGLQLNGSYLATGWSQGVIVLTTATNAFTSGGGIIYAPNDGTTLKLNSFRTDANTLITVTRTANVSGLQLIKLDDSWDYLRLSRTAKQTGPNSSNWIPVNYTSDDEVDAGSFSHVAGSGNIVLKNPGHYLVMANTYGSLASASTNETQVKQRLTLDGSEINGSYATVYMRGNTNSNAIYEGAVSTGMIIQSTTTNQVLQVQLARVLGTAVWTIDSNSAGTYVNRTGLTIVKLPEGDFVRLQDTNTNNINPAALTAFTWNTEAEKDIASWTHSTSTNTSRIQSLIAGDYLFLGGLFAEPAGVTSGVFNQGWRKNGGTMLQYGQTGNLSVNTTTADAGNWSGAIFTSLVNGDYIEMVTQALGAAGTMPATKKGAQGVRIGSLNEADPNVPTIESNDIIFTDGAGPKWSSVSWSATQPGSSYLTMQIEYLDASGTYALVPNALIPGNSTGTSTSPINISGLSRTLYGTLRLFGTFHCVSGNCPSLNDWTLSWAQGINVSGTIKQFDQTTNVVYGTVAVAVNGKLQTGKTGTISAGAWTIPNVTAFSGDVITVFVQGATSTPVRAVGITKYTTENDITGMKLYQGHLTLGSNDNPTLSNADIGSYDNSVSGSADLFFDTNAGGNLSVCASGVSGCSTYRLLVLSGSTFEPSASGSYAVTTPYLQIDGTLIADGNTINVSKSWRNKGVFTKGTSTVVFTATSTTETIDSTNATSSAFAAVTFGQSSGAATWQLLSPIFASSTLSLNYGTLAPGATSTLSLDGDLSIGSSGVFAKSAATTTFTGTGTSVWTDASASKQDLGPVVIGGSSKTVQLGSGVKASTITINSGSTLDANGTNTLTITKTWSNSGTFTPSTGTVLFSATTTGNTITAGTSSFYNLTFSGSGGNWAFSAPTLSITNNLTISAGTLTLPSGTTTVSGTFDASGGSFMHNNGTVVFAASGSQQVRAAGSDFYNITFNGSGPWTFLDTNATSSRNVLITSGSVTLPSGTLAIGGALSNTASFAHNNGTVRFYATGAQTIRLGGSSLYHVRFDMSSGAWSFLDASATVTGNLAINAGTTTFPTTLDIQGSFTSNGAFVANSGLVRFTATTTGKTIAPGNSSFYDLMFASATGGWTIAGNATSTHSTTISAASALTLAAGKSLEVDGVFSNVAAGTQTWTNSTLFLNGATTTTINAKTSPAITYGTLILGANTHIKQWNSAAATTTVASSASLYSMNHAGVNGVLNIYGAYTSSNPEYWSYATDFDGVALGGGSRAVSVRIASSSAVTLSGTTSIVGTAAASTTIQNQGTGAFVLAITGGSLHAQYYQIRNTSAAGLSLSGTPTVTSLSNGDFELSSNGGTMLTVASTVINANPAMQIQALRFATTTGITSGYNITETGAATSYWWLRKHYGNYAGEARDNDPGPNSGNPGYIRWDDSNFLITVSGHVYADHGTTPIGSPACDGTTQSITIVVQGGSSYNGACNASTGAYSIPNVTFIGDVGLLAYLNTNGGARAVTITKTATADVSNFDLYQNAVVLRHEDVAATTNADISWYGSSNDTDLPYAVAGGALTTQPNTELVVWSGKTFAPGGGITLQSGGSGNVRDGRLYLMTGSTLTEAGTQALSIGGGLYVENNATFTSANSLITFTATTTGKSLYSVQPLSLYDVTFNGSGGGWSLDGVSGIATTTMHTLTLTAGTLAGTGDLVVQSGSVTGGGTFNLAGGTVVLQGTANFGNSNPWRFYNLSIGNNAGVATTTKTGTATTTIAGVLSIAANSVLNAGTSPWVLSAGGTPLVAAGTFNGSQAAFSYIATSSAFVTNASYGSLTLAPAGAGAPTFTLGGGTFSTPAFTIGDGTNPVSVTADTNDPSIGVGASMHINANATFVASNVGLLDLSGSFSNTGTFTHSNGAVLFDATTTGNTIALGASPFYDVQFNSSSGGWTITGNATSSHNFLLSAASNFTLAPGAALAVGGTFTNSVGGAPTVWTGSTLYLSGGGSYTLNTKTTGADAYGNLVVGPSTNVRMWNSSASGVVTAATGSLYSQNNANTNGSLYVWGAYTGSGSDYWDYATDFDGTTLVTPRQVNVYVASSSSLTFSSGLLDIIGTATASTTIQNQGSGTFSFIVAGGTLNAQYYQLRNADASGLQLIASPAITSLSNGDYELGVSGGSMITVASTVIDANPLKVLKSNRFATSTGVTGGYNVTETGVSASSWKFNLHYGNLAGEAYDNDPSGDPGYIIWDNSANQISVAGTVYTDEGGTHEGAPVCDGATPNIKLKVQGIGSYAASCNASTGAYSISGISFNPGDVITVYLASTTNKRAVNITRDPATNMTMDLYENRVIVRHENTTPISIADLAQFDSSKDTSIPFTAVLAATNTVSFQSNTKLIVWTGKTFAPGGNITMLSGGAANAYDGSIEVYANGSLFAAGAQQHAVGGNFILDSGASLTAANSTFTFTATTTGKAITPQNSAFYNVVFNGIGGNWAFGQANATTTNNLTIQNGTLTLPTSVLAVGGSFTNSGGTFMHNNGTLKLTSTQSGNTVQANGSSFYNFTAGGTGGSWSFVDTNATTSADFVIATGTVALPSGIFAVGGSFSNSGAFTSRNGTVKMNAATTGKTIQMGGSSLANLNLSSASGAWTFLDQNATTTGDFIITAGSTTLPSISLSIQGSFTNSGTFNAASGLVNFNATTTGKTINPGSSVFYDLAFASSGGGWTITSSATSTRNASLIAAASLTLSAGKSLEVGGVFSNTIAGTQTWTNSTLFLNSATSTTINTKTAPTTTYGTLMLGANTKIKMWNASAATTTVASTGYLYSMNHAGVSGTLDIWGAYTSSGTEHWSYATDFDGAALGGSSRAVSVNIATSSSVTLSGATNIVGTANATTTIQNQGAGTYAFAVTGGSLNAQYYQIRNTNASGLNISGTPTVSALNYGDYQLAVNGGTMLTIAGTVINTNANAQYSNLRFATSTGITSGYNITLSGSANSAWTLVNTYGNYAGENYDSDGATACGSIRWSDSSCLFVNQAHYRWRNDDGTEGALSSTWYNASWNYRKAVVISNPNASTLTNHPVKLTIAYDASMKSDFSDLRFTDSSGTTSIPFWKESTTASATSTVWVKVPSIPASGAATIYMYFGNSGASAADDGASTFTFFEDFESGSLSGYSADTSLFNSGTTFYKTGTRGLDAGTNSGQKTTSGMYRTGSQTGQGQTIRYFQYVDSTQQDEPCTLFGVQASGQNYALCLEEYPTSYVSFAKNVTNNDKSGTILASSTVTYSSGWYEVIIDWLASGIININVYDAAGSLFASLSKTDTTYSSGGVGFAYWFQHGGWDFYTSRPYAASAPTAIFGAKQDSGGATWKVAEDTALTGTNGLIAGQKVRLRFSVQNTGAAYPNTLLRFQVAPKGTALNCPSVPYANYSDVPMLSSGCGTGAACMTTSTYLTNQGATAGLLSYPASMNFTAGQVVTDPSNQTSSFTIPANTATEVEYAFAMTSYATGNAYCFRTSNGGLDLDNYTNVAEATVQHAPTLSNLSLNNATDISLTEGTTTNVVASATVTDLNGYQDISFATSSVYRSGVGSICSADDNNCYQMASSSCSLSSCTGNSCSLSCVVPMRNFADPTDAGSAYAAQNWLGAFAVQDSTGLRDTQTSLGVDVLTLYGLKVQTSAINFGSIAVGSDTGSTNATTVVANTGNSKIDIKLLGSNLTGGADSIGVGEQKYSTSTFSYGSCAVCQYLTGSATNVGININKQSASSTLSTGSVYWGIDVPVGTRVNSYQGTNTFIATSGS